MCVCVRERLIASINTFLRDNYEVTVKELDDIVSLVLGDGSERGLYGCHLSGGGFGGSIVALLHRDTVKATKDRIKVGRRGGKGREGWKEGVHMYTIL